MKKCWIEHSWVGQDSYWSSHWTHKMLKLILGNLHHLYSTLLTNRVQQSTLNFNSTQPSCNFYKVKIKKIPLQSLTDPAGWLSILSVRNYNFGNFWTSGPRAQIVACFAYTAHLRFDWKSCDHKVSLFKTSKSSTGCKSISKKNKKKQWKIM